MEDNIYSIIMAAMGIGILLWSAFAYLSGEMLMPDHYLVSAKIKDKKAYARQFAKLMALIGLAFLLSSLVGLTEVYWLAVIVLIAGIVVAAKIGSKFIKKVTY